MKILRIFAVLKYMVPLVQLVRASDCGSECHGFESHRAPQEGSRQDFLFWYMDILGDALERLLGGFRAQAVLV